MSSTTKSPSPELMLPESVPGAELHSTTFIDESSAMPEATPEKAVDLLSDPDITTIETSKAELQPFREVGEALRPVDRLKIAAMGALAVADTVGRNAKGRFINLATRFHAWKNDSKTVHLEPLVTPEAPETKHIVKAATDAKAAGDWTAYQRELLKFADVADEANNLSTEALRSRIRRADKKVEGTEANDAKEVDSSEATSRVVGESKQRLGKNEYLNIDNIIGLKKAVEEELSKKLPDLKIAGDNFLIGESAEKLRQEITEKLVQEYFGASRAELEEGNKVRQHIQLKVSELLSLPLYKLQELSSTRNKDTEIKLADVVELHKRRSTSPDKKAVWQYVDPAEEEQIHHKKAA